MFESRAFLVSGRIPPYYSRIGNPNRGKPRIVLCFLFTTLVIVLAAVIPMSINYFYSQTHTGDIPGLSCHNPVIDTEVLASPIIPVGYRLVQAHLHQRHLDRWMYSHSLINNYCWTYQLNSTDPIMKAECDYNLNSCWESFEFTSDPYAAPARGNCNAKQLTQQGRDHAFKLGTIYRSLFGKSLSACEPGSVLLESDVAQKNQQTTMKVYQGLCGRLPTSEEFPYTRTLDDGTIASGRPFYLRSGICDSAAFHELEKIASYASNTTSWFQQLKLYAWRLGVITDHPLPVEKRMPELLDNIEDCVVCHVCHGLNDSPDSFSTDPTLFTNVDILETQSRTWVYDYWKQRVGVNGANYTRYAQNNYGYYFVVLHNRMRMAILGETSPSLYIQVTSDSILTPQLKSLGFDEQARMRPPWGSVILYQLLQKEESSEGDFYVRVVYNGQSLALYTMSEFTQIVDTLTPSHDDCEIFYNNYP